MYSPFESVPSAGHFLLSMFHIKCSNAPANRSLSQASTSHIGDFVEEPSLAKRPAFNLAQSPWDVLISRISVKANRVRHIVIEGIVVFATGGGKPQLVAKHGAAHRLYGLIRALGQRVQASRFIEEFRRVHGLRHTRFPGTANNAPMVPWIQEKPSMFNKGALNWPCDASARREENKRSCPSCYIVFICLHDPFNAGLPVYTLDVKCQENTSVTKVHLDRLGCLPWNRLRRDADETLLPSRRERGRRSIHTLRAAAVRAANSNEAWRKAKMALLTFEEDMEIQRRMMEEDREDLEAQRRVVEKSQEDLEAQRRVVEKSQEDLEAQRRVVEKSQPRAQRSGAGAKTRFREDLVLDALPSLSGKRQPEGLDGVASWRVGNGADRIWSLRRGSTRCNRCRRSPYAIRGIRPLKSFHAPARVTRRQAARAGGTVLRHGARCKPRKQARSTEPLWQCSRRG